jgi:putative N6-adenine-specific DNA methylase
MELFAVCAPGLEQFLSAEMKRADLTPGASEPGGVAFEGDVEALYRSNLHLRIASRVTLRVGHFYAAAFSELRKKAGRLAWENVLKPGRPVAVRAACHRSKLYHTDGVAERVAGAIGDRLGQAVKQVKPAGEEEAQPPQLVVVRLVQDQVTISVDTSGELLHRRGYRLATAKAPLRETLAAGMIAASGWDGASPLLDPFCGSGTIAIEAALQAAGLAPGRQRRFAFMDFPDFDRAVWRRLLDEAEATHRARAQSGPPPVIQASDRDAGAIQSAQANAERAGVSQWITFSQGAVSAIQPPSGTGWVVTNPPYGGRVSEGQDLRNLYAQFGNVLRRSCPGWRVAVLSSDPALLGQIKVKMDTSVSFSNGGIQVRLGRGQVL